MTIPKAPPGTKPAGSALWHSIVDRFELDAHEMTLLVQAVRTADLCDLLEADVAAHGVTCESSQGVRTNPSLVELRQQRVTLARLLAALRLPTGDESGLRRPQRRTAVRAPFPIGVQK